VKKSCIQRDLFPPNLGLPHTSFCEGMFGEASYLKSQNRTTSVVEFQQVE